MKAPFEDTYLPPFIEAIKTLSKYVKCDTVYPGNHQGPVPNVFLTPFLVVIKVLFHRQAALMNVLCVRSLEVQVWLTIVLALLGKLGAAAAFAVIYVYSAELFPTLLRNSLMGVTCLFARFGGMISPYIADLVSLTSWYEIPARILLRKLSRERNRTEILWHCSFDLQPGSAVNFYFCRKFLGKSRILHTWIEAYCVV